jgi:hypothetical protein
VLVRSWSAAIPQINKRLQNPLKEIRHKNPKRNTCPVPYRKYYERRAENSKKPKKKMGKKEKDKYFKGDAAH